MRAGGARGVRRGVVLLPMGTLVALLLLPLLASAVPTSLLICNLNPASGAAKVKVGETVSPLFG